MNRPESTDNQKMKYWRQGVKVRTLRIKEKN